MNKVGKEKSNVQVWHSKNDHKNRWRTGRHPEIHVLKTICNIKEKNINETKSCIMIG